MIDLYTEFPLTALKLSAEDRKKMELYRQFYEPAPPPPKSPTKT